MLPKDNSVRSTIIIVLDQRGEIHGTEHLAQSCHCSDLSWVRRQLNILEADGAITVIRSRGGRGHKTIIRRNRNQPGQPRRLKG